MKREVEILVKKFIDIGYYIFLPPISNVCVSVFKGADKTTDLKSCVPLKLLRVTLSLTCSSKLTSLKDDQSRLCSEDVECNSDAKSLAQLATFLQLNLLPY